MQPASGEGGEEKERCIAAGIVAAAAAEAYSSLASAAEVYSSSGID